MLSYATSIVELAIAGALISIIIRRQRPKPRSRLADAVVTREQSLAA